MLFAPLRTKGAKKGTDAPDNNNKKKKRAHTQQAKEQNRALLAPSPFGSFYYTCAYTYTQTHARTHSN